MEIEEKPKNKVIIRETSKNRNLISKLRDNPPRLIGLKESLKYFTLLKKNHYLERKRHRPLPDDIMVCNCIPCPEDQIYLRPQGPQYSYNCGDRCLNRFTCTECDVELCPCMELCKNRRFQRHEDACVYPVRMGGKGWGLAAGERILKGQFVMQYIGEIFYTHSNLGRRRTLEYSKSTCTYLMKINHQEVIDPTYKGNLARFINHSCEPNCITVKWNVLGEVCIGIFANRDITEDDEFTFDYQFDAYNTPLTKCLCGTGNCKGYLGLKPTNFAQEKWEEHLENMMCKICEEKTPYDEEQLLLCDKCNCGFHMFCLKPKLDSVPKDAWFCTDCLEEMRGEDEKERERLQMETLAQQKLRLIARNSQKKQMGRRRKLKVEEETSSQSSASSESLKNTEEEDEYDTNFKDMKNLENEVVKEMITLHEPQKEIMQQEARADQIGPEADNEYIKKKQKTHQNDLVKQPHESSNRMQLVGIVELANSKFTQAYALNYELQEKVLGLSRDNLRENLSTDMMKECIRVNILEQKVVRKNAALMYQIGNKTSFEQVDSDNKDFFRKENDLTVIGTNQQISVFREVFTMIEKIIRELKRELGIVEGQVKVPVLFLKRLVLALSGLEQQHQVNILYNKQAAHMEEIFSLDRTTPIKIKGSKVNIYACVQHINQLIQSLTVYRLYISRSETKTVQQNLFYLRQITHAEIRISRDSVHRGEHLQRDINHPFFYIQFREKEVCLIGIQQQIDETSQTINKLLEKERAQQADKEVTYFTVLVNPINKENCKQVKATMERQSSSTKVLLFEASHPRKNLTILVLCLRAQLDAVRRQFTEMIQQTCNFKLDHFQDQMSMQMCRYVFKYLQNTMMTQEMAFMKNWDLITPYFFKFNLWRKELSDENWFMRRCANSLPKDYETQLYVQYILGAKISQKLNEHDKNTRKKNVLLLMKKILQSLIIQKKNNDKVDKHDFDIQSYQYHRVSDIMNSIPEIHVQKMQQIASPPKLIIREMVQLDPHDNYNSHQDSEELFHKLDLPMYQSPKKQPSPISSDDTSSSSISLKSSVNSNQSSMYSQVETPNKKRRQAQPYHRKYRRSSSESSAQSRKPRRYIHNNNNNNNNQGNNQNNNRQQQYKDYKQNNNNNYNNYRYNNNRFSNNNNINNNNNNNAKYADGFSQDMKNGFQAPMRRKSKSRDRSKPHYHNNNNNNRNPNHNINNHQNNNNHNNNNRNKYFKSDGKRQGNQFQRQRESRFSLNLHQPSPTGIISNYKYYVPKKAKIQESSSSNDRSRRHSNSRSRSRQRKRQKQQKQHK